MSYFPEPYTRNKNKIEAELDLSNYATKSDLKNAAGVVTLKFANKADLASLKSKIDELDLDELETTPVDSSKLSDVVKNEVVKKAVYDELVKKLNAIQNNDTSGLVKKLTMKQKLVMLKRKYLIIIMINIKYYSRI